MDELAPHIVAAVACRRHDGSLAADAHLHLPGRLLAVATGMGEPLRAERAARQVIEAARCAALDAPTLPNLVAALDWGGVALRQRAHATATFTGLLFDRGSVSLAHIGSGRCYRMRVGALAQLSVDHTFGGLCVRDGAMTPAQVARSPVRNLLTRALGGADAEVDTATLDTAPGDTLLLATCGLHLFVSDETIAAVLGREDDLERAAVRLALAASDRGSPLDITAIVARVA